MDKKAVIQKAKKYLIQNSTFAFRVCKLLKDGDFNNVLSSKALTRLLNEGVGKKIKVIGLTALMVPLQKDDIVKVIIVGKGQNKKKIWFPGWMDRKDAEQKMTQSTTIEDVLFFTGNKNWTDPNKKFPKVIEMLKGDLCIVDPYYGNGTFYVLEKFGDKRRIRFLTCDLGNDEKKNMAKFEIGLRRFRKEFKNIDMRTYAKSHELHDRYIIADNALVVIGHGIKDLANKESFVVFLPKKIVSSFLSVLKKSFENRWTRANNLK